MTEASTPTTMLSNTVSQQTSTNNSNFYKYKMLFAAIVIGLSGFNIGAIVCFPSPAVVKMNAEPNPFRVSLEEQSLIISTAYIGSFVGGIMQRPFTEGLGRKCTLMLAFIPLMVGWLLILAAKTVWMIYIGRIFTGLSYGLYSSCSCIYIAEVCPADQRSFLAPLFTFLISFSFLWTYIIGGLCPWQWLIVSYLAVNVLMIIGLLFVPESPRWLLMKGYKEAAMDALKWLRGEQNAETEYNEIENNIKELNAQPPFVWKEMLKYEYYYPLILSTALFVINRWTGIAVIDSYSVTIFGSTGTGLSPFISTVIIGAVEFACEFLIYGLIGRFGRRWLLVISGTGMAISLASLAIYFKFLSQYPEFSKTHLNWLPLTSVIMYFLTCDLGWNSLPYVLLGELLPLRIRGFASGIVAAFNSISLYLTTLLFGIFIRYIGEFGAFLIFAASAAFGVIFAILILPETKDKSLEEIEKEFRKST